jgi:hypothetical protein
MLVMLPSTKMTQDAKIEVVRDFGLEFVLLDDITGET